MTRKRPGVQPCGERHEPYLHCLTCNPPPPERPERLQGPEIGALVWYRHERYQPEPVPAVVLERSYVWAPGDPSYHGGARHYDWKVIRLSPTRTLCVNDNELTPREEATA